MTGQEFRDWRVSIGATQEEIAKRAGVTRQMIVAFEQKSDLKTVNVIEAYGLVIRPMTYNIDECIDEITDRLEETIEQKTGRRCKVKINIELCGKEEEWITRMKN